MKKVFLKFAIIVLALLQLYLCTAFLPRSWQLAIDHAIANVLPEKQDQWAITHPALSQEFDDSLRQMPALHIAVYGLLILLLAFNGWLIVKAYKALRHESEVKI